MIRQTVMAAKEAGIPVSVCGEMAGDEKAIPIWLHLGVSDLSMSSELLLRVKHRILNTFASDGQEIGASCFRLPTNDEIESVLLQFSEKDVVLDQKC
ncbi:Phosphoenolpyruvate-protein phosphotransferase [compost metagenome]